ncbi:MAG: biotin--[acetyl-CoA-carboxylase] ligase [Chitinophagaceae bacterium]
MQPANNVPPVGLPFLQLQTVDSTNNYAMALAHEGLARHGTVIFAHEQTKGRGQRTKQWLSQRGQNIIMSVVIEPASFNLFQKFYFNMAVALGVHTFFYSYAGKETTIKWPNDIYWCDRKAGGILIENIIQGAQWKYAIVGIGVNINQINFGDLANAISLKQITTKDYDVIELAKELCAILQAKILEMIVNPDSVINRYQNNLYKLGKVIRIKKNTRVFEATIKGVTESGKLITKNGTEEVFDISEIEWLLDP